MIREGLRAIKKDILKNAELKNIYTAKTKAWRIKNLFPIRDIAWKRASINLTSTIHLILHG